MGWNIPWRKTLILSLLITLFTINAQPLPNKNSSVQWKKEFASQISIESERHNYKDFTFSTLELPDNSSVDEYLESKTERQWIEYIKITDRRLSIYRDFIAEIIDEENVPPEILYLPIIESAASPMAVSRMGAAGMWQFMLNSISAYDIGVNEWVDERRDFVKSTRGAIAKLKYNYEKTGDWMLALAAYNCGLNRVLKVVKSSGINNYYELSEKGLLPRETIKYIPKLIAVNRLFQDKVRYGVTLSWDVKEWEEIEMTRSVDLRLLSGSTGIPLITLQQGNRELNYNVTPPVTTGYKLKVPAQYSNTIKNNLNEESQLMEFYKYQVRSGDTLSEIGYYYGLSTNSLMRYNPGVSARNLRVGKTLIIPALVKVEPYGSEKEQVRFKNDYIVKDGDTLWDIAIEFGATVEEIALNSGLGINSYIKKGMRLKVP